MGSPLVLCIDDLPQVWDLRRPTLESQGCWVEVASSGQAAMKMLEEVSVAAVLLEYKLEGMDSEAVACQIKQRFPNLPIVMFSAYSRCPSESYSGCMNVRGASCRNDWCRLSNGRPGSRQVQTNGCS